MKKFYIKTCLKNKYVVTPDGSPIGGLPSKSRAEEYEVGEAQKAHFTNLSLLMAVGSFIVLGLIFKNIFGQNIRN